MAGNANTQIIPANSQEMQSEADNQKTKILEANTSDLHAILKRATLQANLGNWEAVLSDAVTAREMDPRSVDAWKLCARAGLAGGDMDATLDCLHEALLIDCNEREANTFLESAVDVHLNKTLAGNERKEFMCDCWEAAKAQFRAIDERLNERPVPIKEKLLCLCQFWSSLNKLAASETLTARQLEQNKLMAINILNGIGDLYKSLNEYRWALACHFLSFYKLRYERSNNSNGATLNESQLQILSNIALDWFYMNKTSKAVQFVDTTVDLESLQPSKPLCGLLLNFGFWLGSLAQLDREHSVLKRTIRIAEEHDYKVELGYALLNLSAHNCRLGNFELALPDVTRAEQIARLINNNELLSKSLNLIAQCLLKLRRFSEALDQAEKASKLCPNTDMQLEVHMTLGSIYRHSNIGLEDQNPKRLENFKNSKKYFELALKLAQRCHSRKHMCVCLSNLGALHLSRKLYDEAIEYLDTAAKTAATSADKRFLFQNYAHCFLSKYMSSFSSGNRDDRSALEAAEKWLDETEDCYDQMWDGLKRDIDKINWSDQQEFSSLVHNILLVKWLLDKKLEALLVAERFRARSLRDSMQSRQRATEQFLISKIDDIKEVAQKLGHPIVFFSSAYTKMCFLCWIIKPYSNEIISQIINMNEAENLENRDTDNKDKRFLVTDERKVLVNALSELSKESNSQQNEKSAKKYRTFEITVDKQSMYSNIWMAIEPHLTVNNELLSKVIVIPDGELWNVLYPLLTDEYGIRLLHKHVISLAISISSLKANKNNTNPKDENLNKSIALVIGNPYISSRDQNEADLPMATEESLDVKNILEGERKLLGLRVEHFSDTTATKEAVLSNLRDARLFHIASHAKATASSASELPGSLLLASDPSNGESGLLRAEEIEALDLRGLRLAFLNCCYTGTGQIYSEGLIGLARAFLFAGAHEVVVSMRPVSDAQHTCEFVNKFYEEYFGNAKGEADVALNEAQKHMEQNFRDVDVVEWGSYYVIRQMICDID